MAEPMLSVGVIGLGRMGLPMALRLHAAGHRVLGFDAMAASLAAAADQGLPVTSDLGEVARSSVLILMLPNSAIVEDVLLASRAIAHLPAGAVIIDMSSSEPVSTRKIAEVAAESGISVVDAPVSGGVRGAIEGTLTIMVGGDDDRVAATIPLLSLLGERITHVGPVGAGHALKALNNLLSATHLLATAEAIAAGKAFGLDPAVMIEAINGSSGRSGSTENKWPNFVLPGTFDSGFGLRLMLKDMRIALGLVRSTGTPSALSSAAVEVWDEAADQLDETADHTEVAAWIQAMSGTNKERN